MTENNILRDIPVTKITDEKLGLETYAAALSEFIFYCDSPVTIGIQGDWGIGKTSLLNMIVESLGNKRPKFYTLKIETWQYALFTKEEHIAFSVINAINEGVLKILEEEKKDIGEKKKFFKKFAKFGLSLADQIIANKTGASIQQAGEDSDEKTKFDFEDIADAIKQYKEEFKNLLEILVPTASEEAKRKDTEKKLVIMLDDLDRIKPIRALELLEAIKNFLDIPKCVFILAVDYSVIEQGMEEKLGKSSKDFYGKSFFDKIIQIPFNMPIASYKTDKFVMSMLGFDYNSNAEKYTRYSKANSDYEKNNIEDNAAFLARTGYSSLGQDTADYFANITQLTTKNNPRSIKRLVNYSNLLKLICTKNREAINKNKTKSDKSISVWSLLDAKIVYTVAALQLTWPEIFNHFAANPAPGVFQQLEDPNYIADIQEAKPLFDRVKDPLEVQSKISGLFDQFLILIDGQEGKGQDDGEISTEEFKPVWQILIDTNLTNAKLENITEQWKNFELVIYENLEKTSSASGKKWVRINGEDDRSKNNKNVKQILDGFKKGNWNNQLYFRLLDAGKSFRNIAWGKKQIGSIVSIQGDIIILYINEKSLFGNQKNDFINVFRNHLQEDNRQYISHIQSSHYGVGEIKVDLLAISKLDSQGKVTDVLNNILDVIRRFV